MNKISAEEMNMITEYRRAYGYKECDNAQGFFAISPEILRVWEKAKEIYLSRLFNGELTITKKLTYEKSRTELEEEIENLIDGKTVFGRLNRNSQTFTDAFFNLVNSQKFKNKYNYNIRWCINSLLNTDNLISNHYDGDDFILESPNNKPYHVTSGQKIMKILAKIANIYNLPGFEDFRICHSQILNQKQLSGNLTISIHPLDYMTMSDNCCGWDSCMSWAETGSYRQGTVEMMNSKCVVVAYLAADENMEMPSWDRERHFWNNKKWRQLFVVDKGAIIAVKDYPYHNSDLSRIIIEWLAELAKERLGWTYDETKESNIKDEGFTLENGAKFRFNLLVDHMYNDFGALEAHWVACNSEEINNNLTRRFGSLCYDIPYSGSSQCMICGNTGENFEDDGSLACTCCESLPSCECCEDHYQADELIQLGDRLLCPHCYEENVGYCEECGDPLYAPEAVSLYVAFKLDNTNAEAVRRHIEGHKPIWGYSYDQERLLKENPSDKIVPFLVSKNAEFFFCDKYCQNDWLNAALKSGATRHTFQFSPFETREIIYWQDLEDNIKEEYRWGNLDDNYIFDEMMYSSLYEKLFAVEEESK